MHWKEDQHASRVTRKKINTRVELLERRHTHAPNVRKVANRCVFSTIRASGCFKSRLAKAAGAKHICKSKCTKLFWRFHRSKHICKSKCTRHHLSSSAIFEVPISKNGPVARSAFVSRNVQSTACSDHFLKFRCRKISVNQSVS